MILKICEDKVTDNLEVNVKIAENQPQYQTLPANYKKGVLAFAFELGEEDIKKVIEEKRIYILLETFGGAMQPINVAVDQRDFEEMVKYSREQMQEVGSKKE